MLKRFALLTVAALLAAVLPGGCASCRPDQAQAAYDELEYQMEVFVELRVLSAGSPAALETFTDGMRAVREETAGLSVPACAAKSHRALLDYMQGAIYANELALQGEAGIAQMRPVLEETMTLMQRWRQEMDVLEARFR